MQKLKNICCLIACTLILSGCIFGRGSNGGDPVTINPGIHEKVLLKIQGPGDKESLQTLTTNLTQLRYVYDVAVVPQAGTVVICLVSGMTYDIKESQKIASDAGYVILKAGKIVW